MKAMLQRERLDVYFVVDGNRVNGVPIHVWGDLTNVWGDLTNVRGNLTGVRGDLTGVRGNVDDCELSDADRRNGVDVTMLIAGT